MAIYNLGSINADHFYRVPRLPRPGETVSAAAYHRGLGGKGANQSVAAARAGARVIHIGAVGRDGDWAIQALAAFGVNTEHVARLDMPTGHAIINVDDAGENAIVIFSAANMAQDKGRIRAALSEAGPNDFCILQNETNLVRYAAEIAQNKGMRVVYSASPFDAEKVREVLPHVDTLVVNEVEAGQLADALGVATTHLPVSEVVVTRGARGAAYGAAGIEIELPAFEVAPVDTTGAGDTWLGFFVAGRDAGMGVKGAMKFALAGAALQVTRPGTAEAIPDLGEVKEFLEERLKA